MSATHSHLRDSMVFGHLWASPEARVWFGEENRTREWLRILGCIALAQSDIGAIPADAAHHIADVCATADPPLDEIAALTRRSGHSTYGLLEWLQHEVGPRASGYVAMATTVQDITDVWTALTLRRFGSSIRRRVEEIVTRLRSQALTHRSDAMLARTHGQPGVPMTLGWKLASWGIELDRHRDRLTEGHVRWDVAALGGSVGTLAYWGAQAPAFLAAVAERTGLGVPIAPWGPARDNVAEFGTVCALLTATLGKIGSEVYQLQRPELAELREAEANTQVSSVTMPHKHNPERSEHLATLNTMTRVASEALLFGATGEHERDGRTWKVEWVALPDVCCYASAAVDMAADLFETLHYDTDQMLANIAARGEQVLSEQRIRAMQGKRRYRDAYRDERTANSDAHAATADDELGTKSAAPDTVEEAPLGGAILSAEALVDRWLGGYNR